MRTTVYTCDVCKQSKSESDLSKINVTTRGITMSPNRHHPPIEFDICKDCLTKKGVVIIATGSNEEIENATKINKKTLEDKLLDILEDLGVAFHE